MQGQWTNPVKNGWADWSQLRRADSEKVFLSGALERSAMETEGPDSCGSVQTCFPEFWGIAALTSLHTQPDVPSSRLSFAPPTASSISW